MRILTTISNFGLKVGLQCFFEGRHLLRVANASKIKTFKGLYYAIYKEPWPEKYTSQSLIIRQLRYNFYRFKYWFVMTFIKKQYNKNKQNA